MQCNTKFSEKNLLCEAEVKNIENIPWKNTK